MMDDHFWLRNHHHHAVQHQPLNHLHHLHHQHHQNHQHQAEVEQKNLDESHLYCHQQASSAFEHYQYPSSHLEASYAPPSLYSSQCEPHNPDHYNSARTHLHQQPLARPSTNHTDNSAYASSAYVTDSNALGGSQLSQSQQNLSEPDRGRSVQSSSSSSRPTSRSGQEEEPTGTLDQQDHHDVHNGAAVLTLLGASKESSIGHQDTAVSKTRCPARIKESLAGRKKRRLPKGDCFPLKQHSTAHNSSGHHEQASADQSNYLTESQRSPATKIQCQEYSWRQLQLDSSAGAQRQEEAALVSIDQSSASAFTEGGCHSSSEGNQQQQQQRLYPLPAGSCSPVDSNDPLAGFPSSLYQASTNEHDELCKVSLDKQSSNNTANEYTQLRILEMRKEKSRDAARSRRSKENHEFYELAKLLPLPAAITSQLDFLDKASIIRLTISFLKLRQFSVNGHPPWAPDFTTTLGSINPYSSQCLSSYAEHYSAENTFDDLAQSKPQSVANKQPSLSSASNLGFTSALNDQSLASTDRRLNHLPTSTAPPPSIAFSSSSSSSIDHYNHHQSSTCRQDISFINEKNLNKNSASLFEIHQGTHILQSLDGFAFAIGRDGKFLYISETVSMYLGLSQVEMTGSSMFDYTHQQDHEELAKQLGIPFTTIDCNLEHNQMSCESPQPGSVNSQYSAASNETLIEDYMNSDCSRKRARTQHASQVKEQSAKRVDITKQVSIKTEKSLRSNVINSVGTRDSNTELNKSNSDAILKTDHSVGTKEDPLVRQFCIRMKSTLTKRGCQHFKSSGYRVVHVVAHLRSYQSNDHGHLMDPMDEPVGGAASGASSKQHKRRGPKSASKDNKEANKALNESPPGDTISSEQVPKQKIIGMVAVAIALPPPSINELRLESDTFVLRLGLDLRVTHIEPKITELLHYPVEMIAGRSLYSMIHPADVYHVQKCHQDLLKKGQMMSGYYRLLARNGGYIWIQTCATMICNTLGAQTSILANSPLPIANSHSAAHGDQLHKLTNYLAPSSGSDLNVNQYGSSAKIVSPGLSSHLSSNYDSHDQDQCVIFVNHMITNIVDNELVLDVCQSSSYTPLSSFSGSTNSTTSNALFNSSSSGCSSPFVGSSSLVSTKGATSCDNYASPSVSGGQGNSLFTQRRQQIGENQNKLRANKINTNGKRAFANKLKSQIYSSDENIHNGHGSVMDPFAGSQADQAKMSQNNQYESVGDTSTTGAYNYSQTPGSVNLALNKVHSSEGASWLTHHHHQTTTTGSLLNEAHGSGVYGSAPNQHSTEHHYSTMNRSIYKAAFGLDVSAASYNQQPAGTVYGTGAASYPAQAVATSWDSSAAVAAVAAASNLGSSHPYAHFESHQHSLASSSNHASSAGSYYNYYGYHGNRFI